MRKYFLRTLIISVVMGCGNSTSNDPDIPVPNPAKPVLALPVNDEACTNGTIVSDTSSTVTFKWNAAANTESYELSVKDLETNIQQSLSTNQTELSVTLHRGTPYAWVVIAKSTKTTVVTQSDVWKFYNSAPGLTYYVPFPAELVSPAFAQVVTAANEKITLEWKGGDADNDIAGYDVYFGTGQMPAIYKSDVKETVMKEIQVSAGTTYYWKIVTKDKQSNTSESEVYRFQVN